MTLRDTIVALATPQGRGGLGIVRLSGDGGRRIAEQILRFRHGAQWRPWSSQMAELIDDDDALIDHVVVSFFEQPRSYTAEDVVEISCHGSPVVLRCCVE